MIRFNITSINDNGVIDTLGANMAAVSEGLATAAAISSQQAAEGTEQIAKGYSRFRA